MKHLLLTTIAAVLLVGCGESMSIHDAAKAGNIEVIKQHLTAGTDVNAKSDDGGTPLLYAAGEGHKEIAELLIAEGANVNAKNPAGATILHTAASLGHSEIAELLIAKGADVNESNGLPPPLHYAFAFGKTEVAKLLIANGADVNAKGFNGYTPMDFVAETGHKEIAELLIGEGADVNAKYKNGLTPLNLVTGSDAELADLLRKHGGKTAKELKIEESIHDAARFGITEAIKQHLDAGSDVNAKDDGGRTPLYHAVWNDHTGIAELLISKGANVNTKQSAIFNPLYSAAGGKAGKETIELLIKNGAEINFIRERGGTKGNETPLGRATRKGRTEIATLLRKHGGKTGEELKAEGK